MIKTIPTPLKKKTDRPTKPQQADDSQSDVSGIWNAPNYANSRLHKPNKAKMEKNRLLNIFKDKSARDKYTQIRTQLLQRTRSKGLNSVMITSAGPGDGKTTTAINLALTLAKTCDDTVLLVDCDLKNQTVSRYMGLPDDKGLSNIILDGTPINEVMIWPAIEKLTIISGGPAIQSSSEVLGSPQMTRLVHEMKKRYSDRYIFFDMPDAANTADAMTLAPLVDCIIIVVEEGRTTHSDIEAILETLPRNKVLGYVINKKTVMA